MQLLIKDAVDQNTVLYSKNNPTMLTIQLLNTETLKIIPPYWPFNCTVCRLGMLYNIAPNTVCTVKSKSFHILYSVQCTYTPGAKNHPTLLTIQLYCTVCRLGMLYIAPNTVCTVKSESPSILCILYIYSWAKKLYQKVTNSFCCKVVM